MMKAHRLELNTTTLRSMAVSNPSNFPRFRARRAVPLCVLTLNPRDDAPTTDALH